MSVFAVCAAVCAVVFWAETRPWGKRVFSVVPSIVFVYYLPMFASNLDVIPTSSPTYDWMRDYLLPCSLLLLMITTDLPTVLRIGPRAAVLMLVGTLGVVLGGPLAFLVFKPWLEPETWKGLAALSGSWIGGGANFAALKESVEASDTIIGPIIVVDTAVGYTWMGILMVLANFKTKLDRQLGADAGFLDDIEARLAHFEQTGRRPIQLPDVSAALAVGFGGAVLFQWLSRVLYQASNPWLTVNAPNVASIFSAFTWLVILISTVGLALSTTRLQRIERAGVSRLGYAALYLFLTSIGAKADLAGILEAPLLLLVGVLWIAIHVVVLLVGARLLRTPFFLVAVGSQANIGGAASAPVLAAAYYPSMAPVGLLMGVLGYVVGNYAGLVCAYLLRLAAN